MWATSAGNRHRAFPRVPRGALAGHPRLTPPRPVDRCRTATSTCRTLVHNRPMTSPDHPSSASSHPPAQPSARQPEERGYRSPSDLVAGVLLLALAAWLGLDALVNGSGRTRLIAASGLLLAVPLVVAYTLRPVVRAGTDRLIVRNPFRTIVLPWSAVEDLRASFTCEVFTAERKYQLWSIPVSLRQRKRANRDAARAAEGKADPAEVRRATADTTLDELRTLRDRNAARPTAQGTPTVRWAYELIGPSGVGAVCLGLLGVF